MIFFYQVVFPLLTYKIAKINFVNAQKLFSSLSHQFINNFIKYLKKINASDNYDKYLIYKHLYNQKKNVVK